MRRMKTDRSRRYTAQTELRDSNEGMNDKEATASTKIAAREKKNETCRQRKVEQSEISRPNKI